MTEPTTTPPDTGDLTELGGEQAPFLRITGTYPAQDGRVQTVQLEINVGDGYDLAGTTDDGGSAKGWFIDLCTFIIDAMRRAPHPPAMVVTSTGVVGLLDERKRHAEECDGTCGQLMPLLPVLPVDEPAGQTGGV